MADYTCGLYLKHLLSIAPHVDKVMWLLTVRELHEGRFIFFYLRGTIAPHIIFIRH